MSLADTDARVHAPGARPGPMPLADDPHTDEYTDLRVRLLAACWQMAPPWLNDRIDDLVQTAVMKVMRSGKVEERVEMNNAFVWRLAHSVVVDEIRRHRRRNETGIDPRLPDPVEPSVRANPEAMTGGREIGAEIVDCLSKMAPSRRRAVTLYLQGHSVPEAARLLGFTDKKAENLVYRGLSDLRGCLRSKGLEP
ncbi:MAG: RNA polymerase sigma factor [Alphaproteobacteria bacterium]|nr:RNA polymerase sigma factor [Alphaproteobacteria bacterium]